MNSGASGLLRTLVIYSLVLPLALVIGYSMATPMDLTTWALLGIVISILSVPIVLKFYRPLLFFFWNTTAVLFLLPGRPQIWILLSIIGIVVVILQRTLLRESQFLSVPSLMAPIVFIAVVILITAECRGGFGLASFGGTVVGARRYVTMFAGMAGFVVMISAKIPLQRAMVYVGLFFLGNLLNMVGGLTNLIGPSFYWVFLLFPVDAMPGQSENLVTRSYGITMAGMGVFTYLLARYGLGKIVSGRNLFRLLLLIAMALVTMMGGYRFFFLVIAFTAFFLAFYEGLLTSRYSAMLFLVGILAFTLMVPLAHKLPLSIQRTLSVIPAMQVSEEAKESAQGSTDWRLRMWQNLLPEVPKYLWLGKGLAIDVQDFALTRATTLGDVERSYQSFIMAGDFHNGPLTVLINFGIWGAIGWVWLLIASWRALQHNYLYGAEELKAVNRLLLALFLARVVNFMFVFGSFHTDLPIFLGIVGLSLSLNGGIRRRLVAAPANSSARIVPTRQAPLSFRG